MILALDDAALEGRLDQFLQRLARPLRFAGTPSGPWPDWSDNRRDPDPCRLTTSTQVVFAASQPSSAVLL